MLAGNDQLNNMMRTIGSDKIGQPMTLHHPKTKTNNVRFKQQSMSAKRAGLIDFGISSDLPCRDFSKP